MKIFICLMLLSFSTFVFAETCFKATAPLPAEAKLPEVVCVNSYGLQLVIPGLPKTPFYEGSVITNTGSAKKTVTFYDFEKSPFKVSLSLPVVKIDYGVCSWQYRSKIVVEFDVDAKGTNIENGLRVFGVEEENNDSCHLKDNVTVVKFERI